MSKIIQAKIGDLTPDDRNANRGTERGNYMLERSLQKLGAGRSILLDKKGRVIAGNKTLAKFGEIGLEDVLIIQSDGKRLVAVQRTDVDLDSPEGRELAISDNRVGQINLDFDDDILDAIHHEVDLGGWFNDDEISSWVEEVPMPDFEPESSAKEIDVDAMEFDCQCPKCGFQFSKTKP
jgi:hypothetical protein